MLLATSPKILVLVSGCPAACGWGWEFILSRIKLFRNILFYLVLSHLNSLHPVQSHLNTLHPVLSHLNTAHLFFLLCSVTSQHILFYLVPSHFNTAHPVLSHLTTAHPFSNLFCHISTGLSTYLFCPVLSRLYASQHIFFSSCCGTSQHILFCPVLPHYNYSHVLNVPLHVSSCPETSQHEGTRSSPAANTGGTASPKYCRGPHCVSPVVARPLRWPDHNVGQPLPLVRPLRWSKHRVG